VMGCIKNLGGLSFGKNLLAIEYYELPVVMKLKVLKRLCDHVSNSEGYNKEVEFEIVYSAFPEAGSRSAPTSAAKASAYKRINVVANASQNGNNDDCRICGMGGTSVPVITAHGHIIQDVLVSTNLSYPRGNGSVQNVWLTSLEQLRQELNVVKYEVKYLVLMYARGSS
jgi:hypothetical protein